MVVSKRVSGVDGESGTGLEAEAQNSTDGPQRFPFFAL